MGLLTRTTRVIKTRITTEVDDLRIHLSQTTMVTVHLYLDIDSDNDGMMSKRVETATDTNNDGVIDSNDEGFSDIDGDGMDDDAENADVRL